MTDPASTSPAEPQHGRAGRNLWSAILIGAVLGFGFVLVPVIYLPWSFAVIVAAAVVIAVDEFRRALPHRGIALTSGPVLVTAGLLPLVAYWRGTLDLLALFAVGVVVTILTRLRSGPTGFLADTAASVFVLAYVPFMASFALLMLAESNGAARVIIFVLLTVCSDVGGFATGVLFGRHPMAPALSPKKSWEGFAGSLIAQAIAGIALFVWVLHAPWWQGLIMGLVMTISATGGDFAESAIKRDLGIKDMSSLLPGHGGMMDRLDSILPNAVVAWVLFQIFLGPGL